jgi:hypothetical protein
VPYKLYISYLWDELPHVFETQLATTTQKEVGPKPNWDNEIFSDCANPSPQWVEEVKCEKCMCHTMCVIQSEDEIVSGTTGASENVMQTTTFIDEMEGVSQGEPAVVNDYEVQDVVTSASLAQFLSRPVRISSITWNESDAVGTTTTLSPWNLFFNNPAIKYKLNNYSFLRCSLKVKVIINASPFYFGAMRVCYQPLPAFKKTTIQTNAAVNQLIPYSQQPGIWISPQHSEGGEMTLPFFYQKNFLRIQVAQDFTDMGTLRLITYTGLASANGVTGQGVSVQVYAWAEDVVIAGPSLGLAMQSQDEYGTGPVSGPASTVARFAGMVRGVPIIGKFATATEMGARAVSGIAKLFGYTNVPVIDNTAPYRPSAFPQLASPEIGFPTEKLTLDAKNELTIDPTAIGLSGHDELSTEYLVSKDSYIASLTWQTSTPVDTPLFTSRVTPFQFVNDGASVNKLYMTPLSMVANCFAAWRGDLIFTFKVVASPYHKGRIRISYDPVSSTVQTAGDVGSAVFNTILDIGQDSEVEVRIPYQQALAWLALNTNFGTGNIPFTTSTTPTLTNVDTYDNGLLSVKVLTLLTAPVATSVVPILVFVRGAENMEFANPQEVGSLFSPFQVQSQDEISEVNMGETSDIVLLDRNRINFGECVKSLRPLLRRSVLHEFQQPNVTAANTFGTIRYVHSRFPSYYGYDPNGTLQAKGTVVPASTFNFNWTNNTVYNWVANCYIGQRGSGHVHYNVFNDVPYSYMMASRINDGNAVQAVALTVASQAVGTASANAARWRTLNFSTQPGAAMTNQFTQSGLSVSYPNYSQYKFESTEPGNMTKPPLAGTAAADGSILELAQLTIGYDTNTNQDLLVKVAKYTSVGTDFNLYFFLNVPVWNYFSQPLPA